MGTDPNPSATKPKPNESIDQIRSRESEHSLRWNGGTVGRGKSLSRRSREHEQEAASQPLRSVQGQGRGLADVKMIVEIAQQHDLHPNQVTDWRQQLIERKSADQGGSLR